MMDFPGSVDESEMLYSVVKSTRSTEGLKYRRINGDLLYWMDTEKEAIAIVGEDDGQILFLTLLKPLDAPRNAPSIRLAKHIPAMIPGFDSTPVDEIPQDPYEEVHLDTYRFSFLQYLIEFVAGYSRMYRRWFKKISEF